MPVMHIVRGLPGSGKTTYAKSLNIFHVEADMFFMCNGQFNWSANLISSAHDWCKYVTEYAVHRGMDVVVSNTFITKKEMQPYIDMANEHGYTINIHVCTGDYGSVHNVPEETINCMKRKWED